jgi:hypothetical protein
MDDFSSRALRPAYDREFALSPPKTCGGAASDPALVRLSHDKLRRLHPSLYGLRGLVRATLEYNLRGVFGYSRLRLREWVYHGDSRAAVVVSDLPLIVAAYTDELDCVALLRFPDEYGLRVGARLLTANTYEWRDAKHPLQRKTAQTT